jgi:hypothetical protein
MLAGLEVHKRYAPAGAIDARSASTVFTIRDVKLPADVDPFQMGLEMMSVQKYFETGKSPIDSFLTYAAG